MAGGRDYYAVLKVARTATNVEIKAAYRKIALVVHPDVSKKGDKEAAEKFKDASEAYSVLSDIEARKIYDRTLGARKIFSPPERWKEAAKKTRAERPLYTREAPAGFTPVNEEVWKAWHYGVHTVETGPIQQAGGWLDLDNNREQQYFKRMQKREETAFGVGRGHRYNTNREKRAVIGRVLLRREARLKREKEERMKTTEGRAKEAESESVCSVS